MAFDYNDDYERRFREWKEKKQQKLENSNYNKSIVEKTIGIIKEDTKILKKKIEQIEQSIGESLNLPNRPRLKLFLTVLAYAIPAMILVLLLFYIFKPVIAQDNYSYYLDVGIKGDDSPRKAFYLEKSKALSPNVLYGEETYREIVKTTPFEISFKSPVIIYPNASIILSLEFIGKNSNLYINDKLAFPSLENYELFKEFEDIYLFKKKSVSSDYLYEKENITEFLKENYYGSTIYSYIPLESEMNIEDYSATKTYINNTFRGGLTLLFYTENQINLNFKKQDLNWYAGKDNYTLYIKDLDENIVYSKDLEDDSNDVKNNVLGYEVEYNLNISDLNGAYYLIFENNGKSSDSTIKEIKINTNKVVFYKNFLVLDPMSFYIKNYFDKKLKFYYWHADAEQNLIINNKSFYLGKEYKEINYYHPLYHGDYAVSIEKGDISISNDFLIAPKKENWFDLQYIIQKEILDPDFIIFDKNQVEFDEQGFILHYLLPTEQEQKVSLRVGQKYQLKLKGAMVEVI